MLAWALPEAVQCVSAMRSKSTTWNISFLLLFGTKHCTSSPIARIEASGAATLEASDLAFLGHGAGRFRAILGTIY